MWLMSEYKLCKQWLMFVYWLFEGSENQLVSMIELFKACSSLRIKYERVYWVFMCTCPIDLHQHPNVWSTWSLSVMWWMWYRDVTWVYRCIFGSKVAVVMYHWVKKAKIWLNLASCLMSFRMSKLYVHFS